MFFFIGALIGSTILTSLLHAFSRSWPTSYGKVIFLNIIAVLLAVLISATGKADGGPPNFHTAPFYTLAQIIILIVDLVRTRGKLSAASTGRK